MQRLNDATLDLDMGDRVWVEVRVSMDTDMDMGKAVRRVRYGLPRSGIQQAKSEAIWPM